MNYIDIHGHVNFTDYDSDREAVIARARAAGVGIITVGTDIESSRQAIALAESYEDMWAIVGIHPTDAHTISNEELVELKRVATHPKVVAIGECGLDYFHGSGDTISQQKEVFLAHIQIANELKKPLMLHVRNGKDSEHNAYQEVITLLKEHATVRANFHFFAGTSQDAQDIVAMGNTMSFTGVLTFARTYDDSVKSVPLTSIMSETDCPFVAPTPYRGKRNEPVYVIETVKKIAEIRGENIDSVATQLLSNAKSFFGLTG